MTTTAPGSTEAEGPMPPLPQPDPVTQFFWDGVAEGEEDGDGHVARDPHERHDGHSRQP